MSARRSTFDLVEGFQLAHAVRTLDELGVLASLARPRRPRELGARHGLDAEMLAGILEYVAARTDLVRRTGERFVATPRYADDARFLLRLYVGAYGSSAATLGDLLRRPSAAPRAVDRARQARAFEAVDGRALGFLPSLIRQLGFDRVLDLGCGTATLLLELARENASFTGWGLDASRHMCASARARIRAARLGQRVRVLEGDCRALRTALPARLRAEIRAVTACNLVNEMFAGGDDAAVAWLRGLRRLLPGRPLLIADYYGRLGSTRGPIDGLTVLHDYAQLISGQGVPPASAARWRAVYRDAGCRLVHVIDDSTTTRFIHLLQL
jgi:SAM-dependent methyltransferase